MNRMSVFSVFALAVFAAFAAPLGFRVVNDHADCLYRMGEEASFTVTATAPDGTKAKTGVVNVTLDNFGRKNQLRRKVDLAKENPFVLKGKLDEPGFLRLTASVTGQPDFFWSVGYEPTKLVKGSPSPDDFDEFWANARKKLAEKVPLDAQVVRIPERCKPAYDYYRVSFATFGRRIYGYMSVPTDKTKAPYPVEVEVAAAGFGFWTNGMGGDANSIRLFFSVYPFEPHWNWEKLNLKSKYDRLESRCRAKYGTGYATAGLAVSREEYFFYPVILGIDRALDWVAARPDVDRSRFWYHGTSQGGGFGFYLAGLNRNFTRAALFVPALTDTMGYLKNRQSGWPWVIESQKQENRAAAEKWAPYFDAANFASRIRCPVRVAVGFSDVTCAPCAVYSAYNAIPVADKGIVHGIGMGYGCHEKYYKELRKWLRAPACAPSATERLRTRLLEIGRSDKFIYVWSTSWWGWNDYWYGKFRQHAGVMPSMYFCEFRDICGTWNSREYYEKQRAKLKEIVKRDYRERGAIPLVTWHLENPYIPPRWGADKDGQGFRYRYVDPGYPQEHRNVLREIAQRTGSPCGSGRVDGVPGKIFPNPREWYEWILKDMLAFWRTVRDDEGRPIPIIIRPFHEMDGDWFWWGTGSSTPQDYIAVYRLTVDMIRKELGAENVLFCYGPDRLWNGIAGEEGKSGYLKWYPGDEYVDMLAIDDYSIGKGDTVKSTNKAIERLRVISEIGRKRGKFCGIAECGAKDSSDDFYSIIHRVMTAPGVDFAIAATYDGPWTFPESEAGKADMRKFFQRPEVLSGDALKLKNSGNYGKKRK